MIPSSSSVWLQAIFLLVEALGVYGVFMIICTYRPFLPKHKPAIIYDDKSFSFYDSMVFNYRTFLWKDIHHFELIYVKGNALIQVHLQNRKLVWFYKLQIILGGLSISPKLLDANTSELMRELNSMVLSKL